MIWCIYDKYKRRLLSLKGLNSTSHERKREYRGASVTALDFTFTLDLHDDSRSFQSGLFRQLERSLRCKKNHGSIFRFCFRLYTRKNCKVYRLYSFIQLTTQIENTKAEPRLILLCLSYYLQYNSRNYALYYIKKIRKSFSWKI